MHPKQLTIKASSLPFQTPSATLCNTTTLQLTDQMITCFKSLPLLKWLSSRSNQLPRKTNCGSQRRNHYLNNTSLTVRYHPKYWLAFKLTKLRTLWVTTKMIQASWLTWPRQYLITRLKILKNLLHVNPLNSQKYALLRTRVSFSLNKILRELVLNACTTAFRRILTESSVK